MWHKNLIFQWSVICTSTASCSELNRTLSSPCAPRAKVPASHPQAATLLTILLVSVISCDPDFFQHEGPILTSTGWQTSSFCFLKGQKVQRENLSQLSGEPFPFQLCLLGSFLALPGLPAVASKLFLFQGRVISLGYYPDCFFPPDIQARNYQNWVLFIKYATE